MMINIITIYSDGYMLYDLSPIKMMITIIRGGREL